MSHIYDIVPFDIVFEFAKLLPKYKDYLQLAVLVPRLDCESPKKQIRVKLTKQSLVCSTRSYHEYWTLDGEYHRDDLPAVIHNSNNGNRQEWYRHGKLHRDNDLPAYSLSQDKVTVERWYQHGRLHREGDLPAVKTSDETSWYIHGKLHRDIGPAMKTSHTIAYYRNGKLHRTDGPALITCANQRSWSMTWFLQGKAIRPRSQKVLKRIK
jgi:hypothetical protein